MLRKNAAVVETMKDRRNEIGVGVLVVGAGLLLAWMSIQISGTSAFTDPIEVQAVFDDVTGLQDGAAVSVAGVEVGRVSDLSIQGGRALVTLSIQPDAQLREDVQVRVRVRSLLGEKYIALYPRGGEAPLLNPDPASVLIG